MIKRIIRKQLNMLGYDVYRKGEVYRKREVFPLNFTWKTFANPLEAAYKAGTNSIIFEVPLDLCRHMAELAFPLDCESANRSPFVKVLKQYVEQGHDQYEGSWLQRYYNCCVPKSAADVLDVSIPALANMHPFGAVRLWDAYSPLDRIDRLRKGLEKDNLSHGCDASFAEGMTIWGKVTTRKGNLELSRLIRVYESIKRHGFKIDYTGRDNIQVVCLYWGNEWRFITCIGQHRTAALAAHGYKMAPVQLKTDAGHGGFLKFEDARYWPVVSNGYLSESEAKQVFERMFLGQQPPIANDWHRLLGSDVSQNRAMSPDDIAQKRMAAAD